MLELSEKQIAKLTELVSREQQLGVLARGLVDALHADEPVIAAMERRIGELEGARRTPGQRREITASIDEQLAALRKQLERRRAANDQRNNDASAHYAVAHSLTAVIDEVLAHAGTSRRALGLDYWRADPPPTALLGMQ